MIFFLLNITSCQSHLLGEFAFVALGIAERSGLIEPSLCKLLLTTVALSMASTPMLAELGGYISNRIEQEKGVETVSYCWMLKRRPMSPLPKFLDAFFVYSPYQALHITWAKTRMLKRWSQNPKILFLLQVRFCCLCSVAWSLPLPSLARLCISLHNLSLSTAQVMDE